MQEKLSFNYCPIDILESFGWFEKVDISNACNNNL